MDLVEHAVLASGSPFGFNSTPAALPSTSPASTTYSILLPATVSKVEFKALMIHPTANKRTRPRYVVVRKRIYFPPRDDLDEPTHFFEPIPENIEEKRQAHRFYKEFFGRLVSMPPVPEEQLRSSSLALALLNIFGLVVCFVYDTRRRTHGEYILSELKTVLNTYYGFILAACLLRAQTLGSLNGSISPSNSASTALCPIDALAVEDADQIEEQMVESMIVVEPLDQDAELEELNEVQTPVEKPTFVEKPMDIEDSDETEECIVESMIVVDLPAQDEELAVAAEHMDTELEEIMVSVEELLDGLAQTPTNRPLRTRSASCRGHPEARVASAPLHRRVSCSGSLRGYVPTLEDLLPPDPTQTIWLEQVTEPTFPTVASLPTAEEVLARLEAMVPRLENGVTKCNEDVDEVLAKIHLRSTGSCATRSSASSPPPPSVPTSALFPPPPPPIAQAVPVAPVLPATRKIRVFTADRPLRNKR